MISIDFSSTAPSQPVILATFAGLVVLLIATQLADCVVSFKNIIRYIRVFSIPFLILFGFFLIIRLIGAILG